MAYNSKIGSMMLGNMFKSAPPPSKNMGFTLVELSIVIVIIGLVVAGVTAGKSVVRAAQLRSVVNDYNKYKAGFYAFKLQYGQLPGDMSNAYSYWGAACDVSAITCNGDNNRVINNTNGNHNERLKAWQHMQLAKVADTGLVDPYIGAYSQIGWSACNTIAFSDDTVGYNVPKTAISNAGLSVITDEATGVVDNRLTNIKEPNRHYLIFGANISNCRRINQVPVILPSEAQNIDSKIDDGTPYAGIVNGYYNATYAPNCRTLAGAASVYNISLTTNQCSLLFSLQ